MNLILKYFQMIGAVLLLLLCGTARHAAAQVTQAWAARFNGAGYSFDEAYALVLDAAGNAYVTGKSGDIYDDDVNIVTISYDPLGMVRWQVIYDGPVHEDDVGLALALDPSGNVYVTGYTGHWPNRDMLTLKYNPIGVLQWPAIYSGTANSNDHGQAVVADDLGHVFVTGNTTETGTGVDITTIEYDAAGNAIWTVHYNGSGNGEDIPCSLGLTEDGFICLAGSSTGTTGTDYLALKYEPSGALLWEARYDGPYSGYDGCQKMVLDDEGSLYLTGYSDGAESSGWNYDYATVKYDNEGFEQWVARYDGVDNKHDYAQDVVVDAAHNVYVTGYTYTPPGPFFTPDYLTIKYDPNGLQLWTARFNGNDEAEDYAYAIAVDAGENVYVTGKGSNRSDIVTVKYDAQGLMQWLQNYTGPGSSGDWSYAIAVDGLGNVYVSGTSYGGSATYFDYVTIKYSQGGPLSLTLTPLIIPIQIPASGGEFDINIAVTNLGSTLVIADIWCTATLPDSSTYGPVLGPVSLCIPGGFSVERIRVQFIPGIAPAGIYSFNGYIGDYPNFIWAFDSFPFEKLAADGGLWIEEYSNFGEDFDESAGTNSPPNLRLHLSCTPNPFNSTTILRFDLPLSCPVNLRVFDVAGRELNSGAHLDGLSTREVWLQAGTHQVSFDGAVLPSGIYFYQIKAGALSASGKMVLLK